MPDNTNGTVPSGNGGTFNPLFQQNTTTGSTTPTATATTATPSPTTNASTTTGTTSPTTPSSASDWYNQVQQQMAKNSAAWASTTDQTQRDALHQQNLQLAQSLGGTWNPSTNGYDFKTPLPSGYQPQQGASPVIHTTTGQMVGSDAAANTLQGSNGQSLSNLPTYKGSTYGSAKDLAQLFGGSYKQDPTTGAITINGQQVQPMGYDQQGNPIVSVRNALAAMGVNQNDIQYDPKTRQITVAGQQQPAQFQLPPMPQMPQLSPYQQPDLSSYYKNLEQMQQFNPDWNNFYQQAHNQIDPTTQNSVNTLLNKQQMDITKADEGLNAKGIFNSGIAVQMENQIRFNTNDQVAKVVMNASAQISKTAQTLYQDALKQWNDGNTQALKNNQMWLTQAMNEQKQSFTQWLQTQKLSLDQYNYALKAWDDAANLAMKDAQMNLQNQQFQQTQAMKMYQFNNLSADQQAKYSGYMNVNGHQVPTLDLMKVLGYVQTPDGKLVPTEQATNDQRNYAVKLAQTMGYMVNSDGSITPTLQAQNDQATQQLNRDKLNAQITQWAQTNKLDAAKVANSQASLEEKRQYDQSMIDKAAAAQSDTNKRTQLEGLKSQLDAVSRTIQSTISAGQQPSANDVAQYNHIMDQVSSIVNPSGSTSSSSSGSSNGYSGYGNDPFTGN